MANVSEKTPFRHPVEFSDTFHTSLKEILDEYTNSMTALEKTTNVAGGYGVCNCAYKMRYITPNNVSTYISNLSKALSNGMIRPNAADIEMFTVASVVKFLEENECVSFEDTSVINLYGRVNPQAHTLRDLLVMIDNDVIPSTVYSYEEIKKRNEYVKTDIKTMTDLHFDAVIRNIVSKFPEIVKKTSDEPVFTHYSMRKMFMMFIEEFILFSCTLNTITAKSIANYTSPKTSYVSKAKVEDDTVVEYVTECCLLKTNCMSINANLPFDCNIRNIVLQDTSSKFNDVRNAIEFILHDPRSPISVLISRHMPDDVDCNTYQDVEMISKMLFKGQNSDHRKTTSGSWSYIIDRNKNVTSDPYEDTGFRTDMTWLDNIAFGNNYLDCNYRRDTTGNHAFNPITNTLNVIYKMYCGCDLKSNEELAVNIKRVSNVIDGIIDAYSNNMIENHELVRDVLSVLGEILTRNMLKLFHNNSRVISYDDNMNNTMIPGYLYSESFVMEADDKTTPSVSIDSKNGGKSITPKIKSIGDLIRKFIDWVIKTFPKAAEKFNKNHKAEMDFIKKNDNLNKEISNALGNGFNPTISNVPEFNIPGKEIMDTTKIGSVIDEFLRTNNEFTKEDVLKKLYPGGEAVANEIAGKQSESDKVAALTNYLLYGKTQRGNLINGVLQRGLWDSLCSDLLNTEKLIDQTAKKYAEEIKKAGESLNKRQREIEAEMNKANNSTNNNAQGDGKPTVSAPKVDSSAKLEILSSAIQEVTKTFGITMINVFNSKFYAVNYKIYQDVVNIYQQQKSNNQQQKG